MSNERFMVESGISIPSASVKTKYPFLQMAVGDSFSFEPEQHAKLVAAASSFGKRHNRKYTVRRQALRCWRIA